MEPGLEQGEAVEHAYLINHVVMAQGEQPRERLQRTIHAHNGEGRTCHRKTQHSPKRADTHRHAQGRRESESEDAKALGGKHLENGKNHKHIGAVMGEPEDYKHIELVAEYQGQPDNRLRQELAYQRDYHAIISHGKPLPTLVELKLHAKRIGRNQEYEKHHYSWHEHGTEIRVVIGPWIAYLMEVDAYGLKKGHNLTLSIATGTHGGLTNGRRTKIGDGLEVFHQQRARHDAGQVVIVGYLRLAGRQQVVGSALGDIEEGVDLVLLNSTPGLGHTGVTGHHLRALEAIQATDERAGGRGIVEIDHTHWHILRQSVVHKRCKEYHRQDWENHHAEDVDRIVDHNLHLAQRHLPDHFQTFHV